MAFIKVNITDDQRKRASALYDFDVLNQSFTKGAGNMTGALGEIITKDVWSDKLRFPNKPSYEYDLEIINSNVKDDIGIVLNKGWKFFNAGYHMLIKDLDYISPTTLQESY